MPTVPILMPQLGESIAEATVVRIGIAPGDQGRIFDRFYRVPNATAKGGYGLGLFLVRHIMEAHGGRAEVDSAPGRGSRFRLVIPVNTPWPTPAS